MKLKAIKYALIYGKSRKSLVRSEGARRVRQAEKDRNLEKCLSFIDRYGVSKGNLSSSSPLSEEEAVRLYKNYTLLTLAKDR